MTVNHQAAIQELRDMHNITMATLHEEHARTMRGMIFKPNKHVTQRDTGAARHNTNSLLFCF